VQSEIEIWKDCAYYWW